MPSRFPGMNPYVAREFNRRGFLQGASLAGIGFWVAGRAPSVFADSPNEKINIACIGVGGKGSSDTDQAANYGNIVALCDIDDQRLGGKAEKFPRARTYNDYRKLLDEMHQQIDAVVVSTPDHTHAPAAVRAMRLGKHVYCQKPLTHSVAEARMMRDVARQYKVATQIMALKLGYPTRVSAVSGEVNRETYPAWATITYEFPARDDLPPVKLTWYEGARGGERNLPSAELLQGETPSSSGALLIGERGAMFSPNDYGAEQKLLPAKQFEGYQAPAPTLARIEGDRGIDDNQKREWAHAILGGPAAMSNFDYAAVLTETMLLGNVAVRVGKPLEYDAANLQVTNCHDAADLISPTYRHGWEL